MKPTQAQLNRLSIDNALWPKELKLWPKKDWPPLTMTQGRPVEVWRSRDFLLQVFHQNGTERLSIMRTLYTGGERFNDGISWDDLQRLKSECGRGDKCAVEIFPPDDNVVNVANMRHLFILSEPPAFMWREL